MSKNKIKIFLVSSLGYAKISLIGQLAISEILAILDLINFNKTLSLYKRNINLRNVIIAYTLFLIVQIFSDLINESKPENYFRGWANIFMAIIVTTFIAKYFLKNSNLVIVYLLGEVFRLALWNDSTIEYADELSLSNMGFFKFKVVPIINSIVLISSYYIKKKNQLSNKLVIYIFTVYAFFCFMFDARSNGVFFALTTIFLLINKLFYRLSTKNILMYVFGFVLLFQGLYSIYVYQTLEKNIGGDHSRGQLLRSSNPYNPLNLIASGRAEAVAALVAISDKPYIGHGSWPPDKNGKYNHVVYELHDEEENFDTQMSLLKAAPDIPSHSVILGAWVTAGIIGFFSMLCIFIIFVRSFIDVLNKQYITNGNYFPILVFFFLNGSWTFWFSPLSQIKLTLPVFISFIITLSSSTETKLFFKRNLIKENERQHS